MVLLRVLQAGYRGNWWVAWRSSDILRATSGIIHVSIPDVDKLIHFTLWFTFTFPSADRSIHLFSLVYLPLSIGQIALSFLCAGHCYHIHSSELNQLHRRLPTCSWTFHDKTLREGIGESLVQNLRAMRRQAGLQSHAKASRWCMIWKK